MRKIAATWLFFLAGVLQAGTSPQEVFSEEEQRDFMRKELVEAAESNSVLSHAAEKMSEFLTSKNGATLSFFTLASYIGLLVGLWCKKCSNSRTYDDCCHQLKEILEDESGSYCLGRELGAVRLVFSEDPSVKDRLKISPKKSLSVSKQKQFNRKSNLVRANNVILTKKGASLREKAKKPFLIKVKMKRYIKWLLAGGLLAFGGTLAFVLVYSFIRKNNQKRAFKNYISRWSENKDLTLKKFRRDLDLAYKVYEKGNFDFYMEQMGGWDLLEEILKKIEGPQAV